MDADFKEKRGQRISSQREKRWSMNSARLEEIVAELMKPVNDLRRVFDRDLSGLLEEYLTEAGVHALDGHGAVPNFAELALVLQHTASAYGRKVDFLHTTVLSVANSLANNTEIANTADEEVAGPSSENTPRRRRTDPATAGFGAIDLEPATSAHREASCARPPPTLPRAYITLAPPPAGDHAVPLTDYSGAPVGLLRDYHCCWSLRDGLLVDGLTQHSSGTLRPIPLIELQQAIEARATPPFACNSPLPEEPILLEHPEDTEEGTEDRTEAAALPPAEDMPPPALPVKQKERKRKHETVLEWNRITEFHVTKELLENMHKKVDFEISNAWCEKMVTKRSLTIITLRRELRAGRCKQLRGFESCCADTQGFQGWSTSEVESAAVTSLTVTTAMANAAATALPAAGARRDDISDDDGFFEQSSLGDSDLGVSQLTQTPCTSTPAAPPADDWASWQARVLRRAQAAEAAGAVDVNKLAQTVLGAIPDQEETEKPKLFTDVLRETAKQRTDVSRLFLATLFLANSGNVEIIEGPPLTVDTFSVRVLSRDTSRYSQAADELFASATDSANTTPDSAHTTADSAGNSRDKQKKKAGRNQARTFSNCANTTADSVSNSGSGDKSPTKKGGRHQASTSSDIANATSDSVLHSKEKSPTKKARRNQASASCDSAQNTADSVVHSKEKTPIKKTGRNQASASTDSAYTTDSGHTSSKEEPTKETHSQSTTESNSTSSSKTPTKEAANAATNNITPTNYISINITTDSYATTDSSKTLADSGYTTFDNDNTTDSCIDTPRSSKANPPAKEADSCNTTIDSIKVDSIVTTHSEKRADNDNSTINSTKTSIAVQSPTKRRAVADSTIDSSNTSPDSGNVTTDLYNTTADSGFDTPSSSQVSPPPTKKARMPDR